MLPKGLAQVVFWDNIQPLWDGAVGQERWAATPYTMTTMYRRGLAEDIAGNYPAWLDRARAQEAGRPESTETPEERIKALERDNLALADALAAMYEVMLGGDML